MLAISSRTRTQAEAPLARALKLVPPGRYTCPTVANKELLVKTTVAGDIVRRCVVLDLSSPCVSPPLTDSLRRLTHIHRDIDFMPVESRARLGVLFVPVLRLSLIQLEIVHSVLTETYISDAKVGKPCREVPKACPSSCMTLKLPAE